MGKITENQVLELIEMHKLLNRERPKENQLPINPTIVLRLMEQQVRNDRWSKKQKKGAEAVANNARLLEVIKMAQKAQEQN